MFQKKEFVRKCTRETPYQVLQLNRTFVACFTKKLAIYVVEIEKHLFSCPGRLDIGRSFLKTYKEQDEREKQKKSR